LTPTFCIRLTFPLFVLNSFPFSSPGGFPLPPSLPPSFTLLFPNSDPRRREVGHLCSWPQYFSPPSELTGPKECYFSPPLPPPFTTLVFNSPFCGLCHSREIRELPPPLGRTVTKSLDGMALSFYTQFFPFLATLHRAT